MNTPGPWIVVEFPGDPNAITIRTPDEELIATAWSLMKHDGTSPFTDNQANARLIAAAPDLLKALEESLEWCGCNDGIVNIRGGGVKRGGTFHKCVKCVAARALIAKAKGGV